MVVEDEIRAKGLGVALEGDEEDVDVVSDLDFSMTFKDLETRYYRARFESSRDGMWFSIALNALFALWIGWSAWRG